jgi:hypothetical protein
MFGRLVVWAEKAVKFGKETKEPVIAKTTDVAILCSK